MKYRISEAIKSKIRAIPDFKSDISKIKSISAIRSKYGISADETIIAYRVVPKLFAKLDKGGTVFTDQGVYKRLPSGMMSSDYVTYGLAYEDIVKYIPVLGYNKEEQPELLGKFSSKNDLSFWLTPVLGAECTRAMVEVFWEIIREIISSNAGSRMIFASTQTAFVDECDMDITKNSYLSYADASLLKQLVERNMMDSDTKETALRVLFDYDFLHNSYADAYEYLEKHRAGLDEASLQNLRNEISTTVSKEMAKIGVPEYNRQVEALKLFAVKQDEYTLELLPRIITYYFKKGSYSKADEFISQFAESAKLGEMQDILKLKIEETLSDKVASWQEKLSAAQDEESSASASHSCPDDEEFLLYALAKPEFYHRAGRELVKRYCDLGNFAKAQSSLEKVREVEDNRGFMEELQESIKGYEVAYAAKKYAAAQDCLSKDSKGRAITLLREAVKHDASKQEYALTLIQTEIDSTDYEAAQKDIGLILTKGFDFDEEGQTRFQELEAECAECLTKRMCAFYDLIANNDAEALSNEKGALAKVDQLGLSFYHYAILNGKEKIIGAIDVSSTSAEQPVSGFSLLTFAVGTDEQIPAFVQLLKQYDKEARKLRSSYKSKKFWNGVGKVASGILDTTLKVAGQNGRMDYELRRMERDARYAKRREEIAERREKLAQVRAQACADRERLHDYTKNLKSGDELEYEYNVQLSSLIDDKYGSYQNELAAGVKDDNFVTRLIYVLIKNPKFLQDIFHGDRNGFVLHEEKDRFWYLPEELITEAGNLEIENLVIENQNDSAHENDSFPEEDYSYPEEDNWYPEEYDDNY